MSENTARIMFLLGFALILAVALVLIVMLLVHKRRQAVMEMEKAALEHQYATQLLQARLEAQEASFQAFSEEIHDNVGQVLSVLGMYLHQLGLCCDAPRAQDLVRQSTGMLGRATADLRNLSHTLNAGYIGRTGLLTSLEDEVRRINAVQNVVCTLSVEGEPTPLPPDRELLLFRILQEALSNSLRHAGASRIAVKLAWRPGSLRAAVQDDGRGFDAKKQPGANDGIGLQNMQLRARLLGGALGVRSRYGSGTTLTLTIATQATTPSAAHVALQPNSVLALVF